MGRTAGMGALLSLRVPARNGWRLVLLALVALLLAGCGSPAWLTASALSTFTPPFLGPSDFQGSYDPRPGPALHGLQSTYSGTVAVTSIRRDIVQSMLPPGLFLAPPKTSVIWGSTRHPVLHLIGAQRAPTTFAGGVEFPPIGPGYEEMILIVPFVLKANTTLWHNYVVRMYLTDYTAVVGGNAWYGYAKVQANIQHPQAGPGTHYVISSLDGATTWFVNDIDIPGPPGSGAALARWDDVRKMLEMPVLGIKDDGVQVCSYWELDYANATVASTVSRHQVITKFRHGMEAWENMGRLRSAPDGAFALQAVRWRLATPTFVPAC